MNHGVLLIGGHRTHQENYGPVFQDHPHCTVVAVTDGINASETRIGHTRRFAESLQVPYFADLDEALAHPEVTMVSMCADVEVRGEVAARCAATGKHLYLDKPLAGSVNDARRIATAVHDAGVTAQMMSWLPSGWIAAARSTVDSGRLGSIQAVHVETVFAKGQTGTVPPGTVRHETALPDRFTDPLAKHELFDIGVYAAGLVCIVTGRRAVRVSGLTGNYFFAEHAEVGFEDFGALMLELDDGSTATLLGGRFGYTSHPSAGLRRIVLIGANGRATFDGDQPRLALYNDDTELTGEGGHPEDPMGMWRSTRPVLDGPARDPWVTEPEDAASQDIDDFIRAVETGAKPDLDVDLSMHLTEILLAGYQSAIDRAPIELD